MTPPDQLLYEAPADQIPDEDKARLEGFLHGQAEAHKDEITREKLADAEARLEALLAEKKNRPPR